MSSNHPSGMSQASSKEESPTSNHVYWMTVIQLLWSEQWKAASATKIRSRPQNPRLHPHNTFKANDISAKNPENSDLPLMELQFTALLTTVHRIVWGNSCALNVWSECTLVQHIKCIQFLIQRTILPATYALTLANFFPEPQERQLASPQFQSFSQGLSTIWKGRGQMN